MLSEEEKEIIIFLKIFVKTNIDYCKLEKNDVLAILNLIEKQSKEIEELKKPKYIINSKTNEITKLTNDFVSKDKIKAKIEELENYYRELYNQDNSLNEFLIGQDCLSKLSILQEVKQSLLERE